VAGKQNDLGGLVRAMPMGREQRGNVGETNGHLMGPVWLPGEPEVKLSAPG
jgi:hypothetical protein